VSHLKKPRLLLIHRTVGIDKDSRIRKLTKSFSKLNHDVYCLLWERENLPRNFRASNGTVVDCRRLKVCSKKRPRGGTVISIIEILQEFMQASYLIYKYQPDILIVQNHRQFLHIFTGFIYKIFFNNRSRIIWDLRELPGGFDKWVLSRFIFKLLLRVPSEVWIMNSGRLEYMKQRFSVTDTNNWQIIPNYCDEEFIKIRSDDELSVEKEVEKNGNYVYLQNPFSQDRFGYQCIAAVLLETDLRIVITGTLFEHDANRLVAEFGKEMIQNRCTFMGSVPEVELKDIIDHCMFSIIFYNSNIQNNFYCDANRLYQCLARKKPVLVGHNPGLSDYVGPNGYGVVLSGDGSDIEQVKNGIKIMLRDYKKLC